MWKRQVAQVDFVKRKDPLEKSVADKRRAPKRESALRSKSPTAAVRRETVQRAMGKCEYQDPLSGRIYGSRVRVEVDHRRPKAIGANLMCRYRSSER